MKRFKLWPGLIFGLLSINVTVVAITVYAAHADRSFAVEPDYYQKALHWDQTAQERARNRELGWKLHLDPGAVGAAGRHMRLTIEDGAGKAVEGARVRVEAFSALRAAERMVRELEPAEAGVYKADMPMEPAGLWEFQVRAVRGAEAFSQTMKVEIPGGRP